MLSIVLSRKDIKEYDQTVSLYTREIGKVEVVAKGIKKIISKNSANLAPGSLVEAEIIPGKEIDYLGATQSAQFFKNIYKDLDKIFLVSYILKLVDRNILSGQKDYAIFNLLLNFLEFINSASKINSASLATGFIFKFWHHLGFGDPGSAFMPYLTRSWQELNDANTSRQSVWQAYDYAHNFAQKHAGFRLEKFVENGRIV